MATPSRNTEGSCPGRLNLVTSKDRDVFLKAIHKDFIEKIDPLESGLMDKLYEREVLTETDSESLQGNNVNTRRDKARKLLIILTEIPFNVFSSRVVPLLCSMFPYIIPRNFWSNENDMISSDDQQNGTNCLRCAIKKRVRANTLADLLYAANSFELPTYKKIISHGYNDEDLWAQIFQAFTRKPPDVSKHLSDEVTSILQRYSFYCPENLHYIMSQGFPCECRKVDHVKPSSFEKVMAWQQADESASSVLVALGKMLSDQTPLELFWDGEEADDEDSSTHYPGSEETFSSRDKDFENESLPSSSDVLSPNYIWDRQQHMLEEFEELPEQVCFYHYTSYYGALMIQAGGIIKEGYFSHYGAGVYGTTMEPNCGKRAIAMNNWRAGWHKRLQEGRADFGILIHLPNNKVTKCDDLTRDIYKYDGNLTLNDYQWETVEVTTP